MKNPLKEINHWSGWALKFLGMFGLIELLVPGTLSVLGFWVVGSSFILMALLDTLNHYIKLQ